MADKAITHEQLHRLLLDLDFESVPLQRPGRAFRHAGTDTWMVFADRRKDDPARPADLVAVRKQLTERGLLTADEFDRFLAASRETSRTPPPSRH
jgi:hypothetical protein